MTDAAITAAWYDYKNTVYRFAWRMTGSPSIAEDVLQEVFLALIRAPDRFDTRRAPLRVFLLAVARNQVRKRWEKERRWDILNDSTVEVAPMDPLVGEGMDLVARAVQSLPPLQREALMLFEYDGLSLEEVARTVDAEVTAVKSRLNRARENLRHMLARRLEEELMEPLNDQELDALLRAWQAPAAPKHSQPPLPRQPWYSALWMSSIRVPVPVLALILMTIIVLLVLPGRERGHLPSEALREVRLSDFEPVPEANLVVVRRTQYENR